MTTLLYSLDPANIKKAMVSFEFDISKYSERTVSGDWDLEPILFEEAKAGRLLRSLWDRDQGKEWADTEYWKFLESSVKNGIVHCGVTSLSQIPERCEFIDRLVKETRDQGSIPDKYNQDHIGVSITRSGKTVLNNGRHRLCVAKYLKIPLVSVCVNVRHSQWTGFKEEILEYVKTHDGQVYAPLRHFDLRNQISCHKDRVELIYTHIKTANPSVLDVGAHWGSHSIYLASKGASCLAVENNLQAVGFMRRLAIASEQEIDVFSGSIFDLHLIKYDVVLALRILHHFLKTKKQYHDLIKFLRSLDAQEMYFQPHDSDIQKMNGAYRNFNVPEFRKFILDNSKFNKWTHIGDRIGGPIYKFVKG